MTAWTSDELTTIGAAEERRIAPLRRDGTLRRPLTIRVLRHGDDLYVRSINGRAAAWFRGAQVRHDGHIHAGGVSPSGGTVASTTGGEIARSRPSTVTS